MCPHCVKFGSDWSRGSALGFAFKELRSRRNVIPWTLFIFRVFIFLRLCRLFKSSLIFHRFCPRGWGELILEVTREVGTFNFFTAPTMNQIERTCKLTRFSKKKKKKHAREGGCLQLQILFSFCFFFFFKFCHGSLCCSVSPSASLPGCSRGRLEQQESRKNFIRALLQRSPLGVRLGLSVGC